MPSSRKQARIEIPSPVEIEFWAGKGATRSYKRVTSAGERPQGQADSIYPPPFHSDIVKSPTVTPAPAQEFGSRNPIPAAAWPGTSVPPWHLGTSFAPSHKRRDCS